MKIKEVKLIENEVIKDYLNGNSSQALHKKYKISASTVLNILKRNNIKSRNITETNRKYTLNEEYFDKINSPDKAYFLGLLVADGCNNYEGFTISLQSQDSYILEEFKRFMKYTGNIKERKPIKEHWKIMSVLNIYSMKIAASLSKLGVVPAKSHKTYFPDIPEHLWHHFIRGVFDGDGCIFINKKGQATFSIVGNYKLIESIRNIINSKLQINLTKVKNEKKYKGNILTITCTGNHNAIKLYKFLYFEDNNLNLKRKKEKFEALKTKYSKKIIL